MLNLLAIPLIILDSLNLSVPPLQRFIALVAYSLLSLMGVKIGIENYTLLLEKETVHISFDCTGWKSMYLLSSLIISTPLTNFRKKLRWLFMLLPILFLMNILRILISVYILSTQPQSFPFIHDFLWREGMVAFSIALWLLFLKKSIK